MEPFTKYIGIMAPLNRANVDTDAIIPKQYLKSIERTGFGAFLFDDWRYLDVGGLDVDPAGRRENSGFVLNDPRYRDAGILLARENFGCGSSREHAVWALADFGFRVVIAPSFADIFHSNCFKNGVLPITLPHTDVDALFAAAAGEQPAPAEVDLPAQTVRLDDGREFGFEIDAYRKDHLVRGLDDIGLTLQYADTIREYEDRRRETKPWLFRDL
jgi:3-isopropylmalate/(R)-2-methylmalate dehydratase small subunit